MSDHYLYVYPWDNIIEDEEYFDECEADEKRHEEKLKIG
jgi:hypothetical protein